MSCRLNAGILFLSYIFMDTHVYKSAGIYSNKTKLLLNIYIYIYIYIYILHPFKKEKLAYFILIYSVRINTKLIVYDIFNTIHDLSLLHKTWWCSIFQLTIKSRIGHNITCNKWPQVQKLAKQSQIENCQNKIF